MKRTSIASLLASALCALAAQAQTAPAAQAVQAQAAPAALAGSPGSPPPVVDAPLPPSSPVPGKCETPDEIAARVHYERALRAELDKRNEEARREAEATLAAGPSGPFADASHAMILRLGRPPAPLAQAAAAGPKIEEPLTTPPSSGVGPRAELIGAATVAGIELSSLFAAGQGFESKATVATLMVGTAGALAASIGFSAGRAIPQSMPPLLELGVGYGAFATLTLQAIGGPGSGSDLATKVALASLVGGVAGLLISPYFTGGDAGAATTGLLYGAALPVLLEASLLQPNGSTAPLWTALLGGTAGMIAGPLLNRELGLSRGRWSLITLGGGVGALFGFGGAFLLDQLKGDDLRPGIALGTVGTLGGLAAAALLTSDFGKDEPREAHALLHYQGGEGLSPGSLAAAVAPTRSREGRLGVLVNALDARF